MVLQQLAKLLDGKPCVFDYTTHCDCVHRIVAWNGENPNSITHDGVFSLTHYTKAGFVQCTNSVLVINPGQFRHDYTGTSISLVSLPSSNSSRAARYS